MTTTGTVNLRSIPAAEVPMRKLYIAVRMHADAVEDADNEDLLAQGNYVVSVPTALSAAHGANCALDAFHSQIGIKCLDTVNIYVYDAQTKAFLERDAKIPLYALEKDARHFQKMDAGAPAALPAGFDDAVFGREFVYKLDSMRAMLAFLPAKDAKRMRRAIQEKLGPLNRRLALQK